MKINCNICGKEFVAEPVPQTKCGTIVASETTCLTSTIETTCPECKLKESKE